VIAAHVIKRIVDSHDLHAGPRHILGQLGVQFPGFAQITTDPKLRIESAIDRVARTAEHIDDIIENRGVMTGPDIPRRFGADQVPRATLIRRPPDIVIERAQPLTTGQHHVAIDEIDFRITALTPTALL